MSLLDNGAIARVVKSALNTSIFYDVQLHKRASGYDSNGVPNGSSTTTNLRGFVGEYSAYRRSAAQIPDTDSEILIAQHGAGASPATGDEITARGVRFKVVKVDQDPAQATWSVQARKL